MVFGVIFGLAFLFGGAMFIKDGLTQKTIEVVDEFSGDADKPGQEQPMTLKWRAVICGAGVIQTLLGAAFLLGGLHLAPPHVLRAIIFVPIACPFFLGGIFLSVKAGDVADALGDDDPPDFVEGWLSEGLATTVITRLYTLLPSRLVPYVLSFVALSTGAVFILVAFGWNTSHGAGHLWSTAVDAVDLLGYAIILAVLVGMLVVGGVRLDGGLTTTGLSMLLLFVAGGALGYATGALDGWVDIIRRIT